MQQRRLRWLVLHVVLPLCIGGALYLLYRPHTRLTNLLSGLLPFTPAYPQHSGLRWVVQVLPDWCWAYAFSSSTLWWLQPAQRQLPWVVGYILVVLLLAETIQLWLPLLFTFDPADLIAAIVAVLLSVSAYQSAKHA